MLFQTKRIAPITKKIALIVGHDKLNQGAVAYTGETEYIFNSYIAKLVDRGFKRVLGAAGYELFIVDKTGVPESVLIQRLADNGVWAAVELHFNSFDGKARGCEILVYKDAPRFNLAFRQADKFSDLLEREFGVFQRHGDGVKVIERKARGGRVLATLAKHGIVGWIIEPCFANLETAESRAILGNKEKYAFKILQWLKQIALTEE